MRFPTFAQQEQSSPAEAACSLSRRLVPGFSFKIRASGCIVSNLPCPCQIRGVPDDCNKSLIRRLIEKVTVCGNKFTVEFKSGVTVDVDE
jgi:hypothetical protein